MPYEKSKKEKLAEEKGQRKIQKVRERGQKQVDKIKSSSPSKTAKMQTKALSLKKREQRLNQRYGQKAKNVGVSRSEGNFGDLKEVVVTAKKVAPKSRLTRTTNSTKFGNKPMKEDI